MRYNAYCDLPECGAEGDLALWAGRGNGSHPLLAYTRRGSVAIKLGKTIVDPERMAAYEVPTRTVSLAS